MSRQKTVNFFQLINPIFDAMNAIRRNIKRVRAVNINQTTKIAAMKFLVSTAEPTLVILIAL